MKIAIRENEIFANYHDRFTDEIITSEPYNYKIAEVNNIYIEKLSFKDFDNTADGYVFNVNKYTNRIANELQTTKNQSILAKNKERMAQLSQDFIQLKMGEIVPNWVDKEAEFIKLHNEVRALEGKEPRKTIGEL